MIFVAGADRKDRGNLLSTSASPLFSFLGEGRVVTLGSIFATFCRSNGLHL